MANVDITIHMDVVNQILNVRNVPDLVRDTGRSVLVRTVANTPIDSGSMVASNRMDVDVIPFVRVRARIYNTDQAAWWVNRGTGVFNRDGSTGRITPRSARYLRFPARNYPSPSGFVYASSVAGQEANEFMWRGLLQGVARSPQLWTVTKRLP